MRFSREDLPDPELPSRATNSPELNFERDPVHGAYQRLSHLVVAAEIDDADGGGAVRSS